MGTTKGEKRNEGRGKLREKRKKKEKRTKHLKRQENKRITEQFGVIQAGVPISLIYR